MLFNQLTIYGAGLIGGSIALGARKHALCKRLVAVDIQRPASAALESIFDDWAISEQEQNVVLSSSDLTILCVPVASIIDQLPQVLDHSGGVVIDCGSTKAAICHAVVNHPRRLQFVPSHPMAGHPEGGLGNASAELFVGRRWILCPQDSAPAAVDLVAQLGSSLGAEIVHLLAEEHDASVAWTSHVPQVVASALSVHAHSHHALQAAGPGFESATRVAGGAEAMWRDIFSTNSQAIGLSLSEVGQMLCQLGAELESGEAQGTLEILAQARALRPTSKRPG